MMFQGVIASIAASFVPQVLPKIMDLATAYVNKQITAEQLQEKLGEVLTAALQATITDVLKTYSETYATFMGTLRQSPGVLAVWMLTMLSQLFILFWHQWVIPAAVTFHWWGVTSYASSGNTSDWAYFLLAAGLGFGSLSYAGGASGLAASLKSLAGR